MRIAYFDCFGGASGDMIVGALLGAGLHLDDLKVELSKLGMDEFTLGAEQVKRNGLGGTKFHVILAGHEHEHSHEHPHEHEHPHDSGAMVARGHADNHSHAHTHGRNLPEILAMIDAAGLSPRAAQWARRIFQRLGQAEAKAHDLPVEQVHFHEVGAVDSIVDIVAATVGLDLLGVDAVISSPIPLGSGTVKCDHGVMPVPAPATANLMLDGAIAPSDFPKELCTPTGAAILTTLAERFTTMPPLKVDAIGYGAGGRDDPGRTNMLRVFIGQVDDAQANTDTVVELAANIDDATGQVLGAVVGMLLSAGALDAWTEPIYMKNSRPATRLGVLCDPAAAERMENIIFREATTLGIRRHACQRSKLSRRHVTVETQYGPVRVKLGERDGAVLVATPEFADCAAAAESHHVAIREVQTAAIQAYRKGL